MSRFAAVFSLSTIALLVAIGVAAQHAEGRAFYVFGNSLLDNRNNTFLVTTARADSLPYGEQIGSEPTLPYLSPQLTGEKLLDGANFASAGVGILPDTGIQFAMARRLLLSGTSDHESKVDRELTPVENAVFIGGLVLVGLFLLVLACYWGWQIRKKIIKNKTLGMVVPATEAQYAEARII